MHYNNISDNERHLQNENAFFLQNGKNIESIFNTDKFPINNKEFSIEFLLDYICTDFSAKNAYIIVNKVNNNDNNKDIVKTYFSSNSIKSTGFSINDREYFLSVNLSVMHFFLPSQTTDYSLFSAKDSSVPLNIRSLMHLLKVNLIFICKLENIVENEAMLIITLKKATYKSFAKFKQMYWYIKTTFSLGLNNIVNNKEISANNLNGFTSALSNRYIELLKNDLTKFKKYIKNNTNNKTFLNDKTNKYTYINVNNVLSSDFIYNHDVLVNFFSNNFSVVKTEIDCTILLSNVVKNLSRNNIEIKGKLSLENTSPSSTEYCKIIESDYNKLYHIIRTYLSLLINIDNSEKYSINLHISKSYVTFIITSYDKTTRYNSIHPLNIKNRSNIKYTLEEVLNHSHGPNWAILEEYLKVLNGHVLIESISGKGIISSIIFPLELNKI